jgi:hypothetical protein
MEANTVEQEPVNSNFLQVEHQRISREIGYLTMDRLFIEGQLRSALALRNYEDAAQFRSELAELTGQQIELEQELSHIENRVDEWNHLLRQLVRLEDSLERQDVQIAAIEKDLDFAHESRLVTLAHLYSVQERIARLTGIPNNPGEESSDEDRGDKPEIVETKAN